MQIPILIILLVSLCCISSADEINISKAPSKVNEYEPFIVNLELPYFSGNENDPENVRVEAYVKAPSGKEVTVPLFCSMNKRSGKKSSWQMRFSPIETGKYEYSVKVTSGSVNEETTPASFTSKKTKNAGFLRKAKNNDHYLQFDSGAAFFGIGHDVGWVYNSSPSVFGRYFSLLSGAGCNITRIWMSSWALPLEWKEVGEYSELASKKLDEILELAANKGIYIMLCFDTYGSLISEGGMWGEEHWGINPYNKENGGPCEKPEDFFTNPEAKKEYKNRLRYIVSRWGWSTNILAFELWNEYDAPADWVKEMASYIESIDPHGHFVTTSHGYPFGQPFDESKIWNLKEIGLVTFHEYGNGANSDMVMPLIQRSRRTAIKYKKPFIVSEFGIDFGKDDKAYDPDGEGIALHNSLWASSLSKSFGTAMNWWYDTYIRPKNLYPHYKALANFLQGTDWTAKDVEYLVIDSVKYGSVKEKEPSYDNATILPRDKWGKIDITEFTVQNNGDLSGAGMPTKYLHGTLKKDMKDDHVFHVNYPKDGELILHIGTVSQGGDLHVLLDGKEIARKEFPAGDGKGPWKRSLYLKKHKVYQCVYEEDFKVAIPKGEHTITLSNTGKDWIGIEKITFTDYIDSTQANVRCLGLAVGNEMLFWVQNKSSNWKNAFNNIEPDVLKDVYFEVPGTGDESYEIEWWDTYKGTVQKREKIKAKGNKLHVNVPDFERDIACKISKK
ncbi:DUF5060 domain-containing protein [Candidatus Omnitrophota bacterium]